MYLWSSLNIFKFLNIKYYVHNMYMYVCIMYVCSMYECMNVCMCTHVICIYEKKTPLRSVLPLFPPGITQFFFDFLFQHLFLFQLG